MSDEVSEIKARLDIVDIVSSYLPLKRSGRSFTACCPFHQENTPSFHVSSDRQSYHCFGCQAKGDIFTFIMEIENLSFVEALERLAPMAGVTLQPRKGPARDPGREQRWKTTMNIAGHFFRNHFTGEQGEMAREYMTKRGFTKETLDHFKIGFAPDGYTGLLHHAKSKGVTEEDLVTLGLARKGSDGSCYDFFRNRVIFPVRNVQGQVVAFGGRVLDGSEPKYLNSPETPLFNKSRTLFHYHHSKDMVKDHGHFLMMEGYTDVMMVHQAGVGPAVATLGTAMTEDHVRMLKRFEIPLYLVYDGDNAGVSAMEKALPHIVSTGLEARAMLLPQGTDPCDFLLDKSQEDWQELREQSIELFEYKLRVRMEKSPPDSLEKKVKLARIMLKDLEHNRDSIREGLYLDLLSDRLGIERGDLRVEHKSPKPTNQESPRRHSPTSAYDQDPAYFLLALCLAEDGFRTQLEELPDLPFSPKPSSTCLKKWLEAHAQAESRVAFDPFKETLNDSERRAFDDAMVQELPDDLQMTFQENLEAWRSNTGDTLRDALKEKGDYQSQLDLLRKLTEEL